MFPSTLAAGFATGLLLHLLLMLLVAGRPSLRRLDRLFLFLFAALFLWHSGNLLALMLEAFAGAHRDRLLIFARGIAFTGLAALSPLIVDVHLEYAQSRWRRHAWIFYLPLLAAPFGVASAAAAAGIPRGVWTTRFVLYFASALVISAIVNARLAQARGRAAATHLRALHLALAAMFLVLAGACLYAFVLARDDRGIEAAQYLLMLSSIVPSGLIGYWMFRFNFLEARARYALGLAALALLAILAYGLVITRLAERLERAGYLPAAVTEVVLIFLLVVLVDPVWRWARRWAGRRVSAEFVRLEALRADLQARALTAEPEQVRAFAERQISEFFGFPVRVARDGQLHPQAPHELNLREQGALRVLEVQVREALERSFMVAERLLLERELADREKMAALGEMTAFIAHRLKNPLSAINTLVQVIGEEAPAAREHCEVIRAEIRRMTAAVGDLLKFTQPAEIPAAGALGADARGGAGAGVFTPASEAIEEVRQLFAAEARRKGVALEARTDAGVTLPVLAERLHDILTSLLGNALEAAPPGSRVLVSCSRLAGGGEHPRVLLAVEDEGPGVAPELRVRIFDPFFTLKPGGTGLGLALARRRAEDAGAMIRCISPARDGRGARFEVIFRPDE